MGTYNPNDFSPASGKEINSSGNVVTPADGINADGSQNIIVIGRNVKAVTLYSNVSVGSIGAGLTFATPLLDLSAIQALSLAVTMGTTQQFQVDYLLFDDDQTTQLGAVNLLTSASRGNTSVLQQKVGPKFGKIQITNTSASSETFNRFIIWGIPN